MPPGEENTAREQCIKALHAEETNEDYILNSESTSNIYTKKEL